MGYEAGEFDVAVIGAGHAGCEAALAAARMGLSTLALTLQLDAVALMPCNPAIGGTSKGHLVREVDALGGEMGLNADATCIQVRLLNTSKGPAVQSLRAQADKKAYQARMKAVLEDEENLTLLQGECARILTEGGRVSGIETTSGARYRCRAVVVATGVYLRSRTFTGPRAVEGGPAGLMAATELTGDLLDKGIRIRRFKTGTPPRVNARTVDFSSMAEQPGDDSAPLFSFVSPGRDCPQMSCYLTWTCEATHRIIRENLDRSPMYAGLIDATGVRYCPSIEDKVVRFAHKERHQVFLEPEGAHTREYYVQGMSTSLPEDVQTAMLRTIPGLERAQIMRYGYAIEYDCIDSLQLSATLMMKDIPGLFMAGQVNGTSGYEEAAAQGIVAGINAAQYVRGEPPLTLARSDAYAGVLIDDLVTKGASEPYRMMTSRAEYRLLLRQDNADLRLTGMGRRVGLVSDARYDRMMRKRDETERLVRHLKQTVLPPGEGLNGFLASKDYPPAVTGLTMAELLRRPPVRLAELDRLDPAPLGVGGDAREQAEIQVKYEGYIQRQQQEVERFRRLEQMTLDADLDYSQIAGLRLEARQKLAALRPASVGQAARILGVSPADIGVLLVYVKSKGRRTQ